MAILRIAHVAIVVPAIDTALDFWQAALGLPLELVEELPEQESVVAMMPVGDSEVELVQPTTETSGVAAYMARKGPGLHHICFEVDDIESTLEAMKSRDVQLINDEPTIGTGGRRVAFIHPKSASGVLVELVESNQML